MAQKSRLAAWAHIVCACFVLVFFLSFAASTAHAGHANDCLDDDCAVCCVLHTAQGLLRTAAVAGAAAITLAAAFGAVALPLLALTAARRATPVLLADRINS